MCICSPTEANPRRQFVTENLIGEGRRRWIAKVRELVAGEQLIRARTDEIRQKSDSE
jgi:hypothetical protein